jgi:hypothetical protein
MQLFLEAVLLPQHRFDAFYFASVVGASQSTVGNNEMFVNRQIYFQNRQEYVIFLT